MTDQVTVPWDQHVVDQLNDYQRTGNFHPYTCPNRGDGNHTYRTERGGDLGALLATPSGWICGECTYTQHWAHEWSLNPPPNPIMDRIREAGK
jgi:hypothetical protein